MSMKALTLAAAFTLTVTGAVLAQTPAGGGSAEGNMNNPGSVKSNSEKSMEGGSGPTGTGMAAPGASGGPSTATTGSTGGSTGGNAVTGSGAAPSGK